VRPRGNPRTCCSANDTGTIAAPQTVAGTATATGAKNAAKETAIERTTTSVGKVAREMAAPAARKTALTRISLRNCCDDTADDERRLAEPWTVAGNLIVMKVAA